jgi:signal transduction histidine kinase/CheY-like chemotaxis protein
MTRTFTVIILTFFALMACLWQGNRLALETANKELVLRAEMSARLWVRHLRNDSRALTQLLARQPVSDPDSALIRREMRDDKVFRFRLFDAQGQMILEIGADTDSFDPSQELPAQAVLSPGLQRAMASRKPVTEIINNADLPRPARFAETYFPIVEAGVLLGVFEVYIDVTEAALEIQPLFRNLVLSVGVLIVTAMFLPLLFLVLFWLKLEKSNRHLKISQQKAQDAERTKAEFLANMSHEIRTPMNGIIAMAELLDHGDLTSEQRSLTRTITQSSVALLSIINDILDFSKIEAGKMRVHNEPFDLLSLVQDAAALFAPAAASKSVEVIVECTVPPPFFVLGDSARLRQCLLNVIGNAMNFTLEGYVHVWVGFTDSQQISIKVSDTGVGIPENMLDHIFEEFSQIEDGRTRRFEGTGLGLAITMRLARLMGGTLTARSRYGQGSVFEFRFPFATVEAPPQEAQLWFNARRILSGHRVMVVEHLEVNRRALRNALGFFDLKPVFARDGAGAQSLLTALLRQGTPPDLCLIDSQLPDVDSAELRAILSGLPGAGPMPSLLMTHAGEEISNDRIAALGFLTALRKPLEIHGLVGVLCTALGASLEEKPEQATYQGPSEEALPLMGKTILLAEDNATNRLVIEKLLAGSGVRLEMAHNGRDAVTRFEALLPDLVLMDVSMPVMNGYAASAEIRRIEMKKGLTECPIVALTANALPEDRIACTEAGMSGFLPKPVRRAELLDTLHSWLAPVQRVRAV